MPALIMPRPATTLIMLLTATSLACGDGAGPQPEARILVTGGNGQVARIGTLLPAPVVVTVLDASGQPLSGVPVAWRATGDDRLTPLEPVTDQHGRARASWLLSVSEGRRHAEAIMPWHEPVIVTAIAEPADALPFDQPIPLDFATYDGSHQVVHPDYAATPESAFALPFHLAITPYPYGNPVFENPSFFEATRPYAWALTDGTPNPVVRPDVGQLSDPDLVYVPERAELWLYYRQVTADNGVRMVRTRDGRVWSAPEEIVHAPNHELVSPSVVRRAARDWWMFTVNAGPKGCDAPSTTVEVRRSPDGLHWLPPTPVTLEQPGLWPWHIDVQWIPSRQVFWAVYNAKPVRGCATPAIYLAESTDGSTWHVLARPVLTRGMIPSLQDIVYRTTFDYDPFTDAVTFWFSGARYEGRYVWSAAVERRHRADLFGRPPIPSASLVTLGPPPAPLVDWP